MSLVIDVAEAVKTELNATEFSQAFAAERYYRPAFDLKEMKDLHVSVVPNGLTTSALGRGRAQFDCRIDVAVQKKLVAEDNAEIDPLMALVEEISRALPREAARGTARGHLGRHGYTLRSTRRSTSGNCGSSRAS